MKNTLTNEEIKEWHSKVLAYKTRCKCGHRVFIDKDRDRVLCPTCKHYVYKDEQTKFRYKMKEQLKKA